MPKLEKPLEKWIVPFLTKSDALLKEKGVLKKRQSIFIKNNSPCIVAYRRVIISLVYEVNSDIGVNIMARLLGVSKSLIGLGKNNNIHIIPEEELIELRELRDSLIDSEISYFAITVVNSRYKFTTTALLSTTSCNINILVDRFVRKLNGKYTMSFSLSSVKPINASEFKIMRNILPIIDNQFLKLMSYENNNNE